MNDVTLIVVVDSPMSRYRLITFGVINVIFRKCCILEKLKSMLPEIFKLCHCILDTIYLPNKTLH